MKCDQQMCLPIGESDVPNEKNVRIYCPRCKDILISDSTLDGAFFGPNLPVSDLLDFYLANGYSWFFLEVCSLTELSFSTT